MNVDHGERFKNLITNDVAVRHNHAEHSASSQNVVEDMAHRQSELDSTCFDRR
jgi:trehalose utilization protein